MASEKASQEKNKGETKTRDGRRLERAKKLQSNDEENNSYRLSFLFSPYSPPRFSRSSAFSYASVYSRGWNRPM